MVSKADRTRSALDGSWSKVSPGQKACYICEKEEIFLPELPLKVAQPAADDKDLEKVDKAS